MMAEHGLKLEHGATCNHNFFLMECIYANEDSKYLGWWLVVSIFVTLFQPPD